MQLRATSDAFEMADKSSSVSAGGAGGAAGRSAIEDSAGHSAPQTNNENRRPLKRPWTEGPLAGLSPGREAKRIKLTHPPEEGSKSPKFAPGPPRSPSPWTPRSEKTGFQLIAQAQLNMRDGVLHLTGSAVGTRTGKHRYTGLYVPNAPLTISGSPFADFAPGQPSLVREHVEFYSDEFNEGDDAQISPVEVAPTDRGQLTVIDGHHRLAAGLGLGKAVRLVIDPETEPAHAGDWREVGVVDSGEE